MCFLKPLRVKTIKGHEATLENGMKAYYEKKIGILKPSDLVIVYGNLVISRVKRGYKKN